MGACDSLVILQPVFQFQPSLIEGQTPSETQSSHRFWKTDIRIEEIGNVTAGKAAEPALLSQDQEHPTDTWNPLGLQLMEILDSTAKCVPAWVVGDVPCVSFLWVRDHQGQAHTFHFQGYPTPFRDGKCENVYSCQRESVPACWCDLEEAQGETRHASLPPPSCM